MVGGWVVGAKDWAMLNAILPKSHPQVFCVCVFLPHWSVCVCVFSLTAVCVCLCLCVFFFPPLVFSSFFLLLLRLVVSSWSVSLCLSFDVLDTLSQSGLHGNVLLLRLQLQRGPFKSNPLPLPPRARKSPYFIFGRYLSKWDTGRFLLQRCD